MSRVLLVGWADREEEERRTLSSGVGESEDTWKGAGITCSFRGLQGKGVAWLWSTRTPKRMTKS